MNEEMQPVSMHDTPHKHHGALPLIAAMLGVFLVLESIVLGYVVTRYVVDEQSEVDPVEESASAEDLPDDDDEDEAKTIDDTLLSHLVLNGESRKVEGVEASTWLQTRVWNRQGSCKGVYGLTETESGSGMGIGPEGLSDPDIEALFSDRISGDEVGLLGNTLENSHQELYLVCAGETEDYVVLVDDQTHGVATLAEFDEEHNYWMMYQPVSEVMDGAISVHADFFGQGIPLVATGYGDAGHFWWRYWVPTEYGSMQLIEYCANRPIYSEDGGVTIEEDKRMLECGIEYVN